MSEELSRVRLVEFDPTIGFNRGASLLKVGVWYIFKLIFLLSPIPWPSVLKVVVLRLFGARVEAGVVIKPRVNVHFPWKLVVGQNAWIGEQVEIYNFELVSIGRDCCLSQRAFICGGNHDFRDPAMSYRNAPVVIEAGAWIGACCFVGPGVTIGADAVATAGSIVTKSLPAGMVCSGNPCLPRVPRWKDGRA